MSVRASIILNPINFYLPFLKSKQAADEGFYIIPILLSNWLPCIRLKKYCEKIIYLRRSFSGGGGLVVSVFALDSYKQSSHPTNVYSVVTVTLVPFFLLFHLTFFEVIL